MKTRNVSIIIINENGFITEILSAFPLPPVGTRVVASMLILKYSAMSGTFFILALLIESKLKLFNFSSVSF
ncbi:MAG: hypothetical protein CMB80_01115 [Flammeovirgaceae bacterium]|nr:hypothetical protein [Flammeovirgaceae bacterium]|tara:strand:+ start:90 stop:302 length:213 start_codon:yes stop_codon:yes gene_type:complete